MRDSTCSAARRVKKNVRGTLFSQSGEKSVISTRRRPPSGKGRTTEWMSFRACEEANDMEFVRTAARVRIPTTVIPKQNGHPSRDDRSVLARLEGFDLPCGAGHLGLQHAPGMLPSALGFESPLGIRIRRPPYGDLRILARLEGFEPPTFWSVARHSIQLS